MSKPLQPPTLPHKSLYSSEASVEDKPLKSGSSAETPTRIYKQWPPPELTKPDSSTERSTPETPTRTFKQWPPPSPSKPHYSTQKSVEEKPFKCISQPETPTKAAKQPLLPPPLARKSWSVDEQQWKCSSPPETPTSPKSQPPTPMPRKLRSSSDSSFERKPFLHAVSVESALKPTEKNTPLPVLPKARFTQSNPKEDDAEPLYEDILADLDYNILRTPRDEHPPPVPARLPSMEEESSLSLFCTELTPWKELCKNLEARNATEQEIIQVKAEHMYKVYQHYDALMNAHQENLQECIDELNSIVLNLDKVSKGTKVAGITGGTAAALGGVAAAAGVILSPVTMGASLALSAVGVGVAAAGGVTGASAAIAHKANFKSDTKKMKLILQQFRDRYEKFPPCLKLIFDGMDQLKLHGKSTLSETKVKSEKAEQMLKMVTEDTSALATGKSSKICGMIAGFALGMDFYFTQGKDGQKIKKELRSKFAHKIRKLTEDLKQGLDELKGIHDFLSQYQ